MILSCGKIIWKAEGLRPSELQTALTASTGKAGVKFRADIDIMAYYHKGRSVQNGSHTSAMNFILRKLRVLAYEGFCVTGVIDGQVQPDCKRSSWERQQEKAFNKVNLHFTCQMAMSKAALLESGDPSVNVEELKKEIKSLNAESKSLENKNYYDVPKDLVQQLEEMIETELFMKDGYNADNIRPFIIESKFQADSMIAFRIKNNLSDVVVSPDTDFGQSLGPDHFIIRDIQQVTSNGVSEQRCEISGYSNTKMHVLKAALPTHNRIVWKDAKFPLFDTPSPKLRTLIAITLGCNVWKGIYNQGPSKIYQFLQKLPRDYTWEQIENAYIGFMIAKNNNVKTRGLRRFDMNDLRPVMFDRDVINTLCSAMMDEPAVSNSRVFENDDWNYVFGKPSKLAQYLHYFDKFGTVDPALQISSDSSTSSSGSISDSSDSSVDQDLDYDMCSVDGESVSKEKTKKNKDLQMKRQEQLKSRNHNDSFDFSNPEVGDVVHIKNLTEETSKTTFTGSFFDVMDEKSLALTDSDFSFDIVEAPSEDEKTSSSMKAKKVSFAPDIFFGKRNPVKRVRAPSMKSPNENKSTATQELLCMPCNEGVNVYDDDGRIIGTCNEMVRVFDDDGRVIGEKKSEGKASDNDNDSESVTSSSSESSDESNGYSSDVKRGTSVVKTRIVPGPPIAFCRGLAGITQPHSYLQAEGTWRCAKCKIPFCRTCGYVPEHLTPAKKKKSYYRNKTECLCFSCYKTVPIPNTPDVDEEHLDTSSLRKKLTDLNVKLQDDALRHELEDMYEHYSNVRPLYESIAPKCRISYV